MLAETRRNHILHQVQSRGAVHVQELADALNVSAMTIRRDLAELDDHGLLSRVHGGAAANASTMEPAYAEKMSLNAEAKSVIAREAAEMVRPGQSVAFSAGTTCTRVAQILAAHPAAADVTVVTNSLPVADEFFRANRTMPRSGRVLLTGGERTPSDALVGPLADASLADLHLDLLFIGAHGAGPAGLSTPNLHEAHTNRALIRAAETVVALWDHTKWGVTGLAGFAEWSDIDVVITSPGLPEDALSLMNESVAEVVTAS